MSAPAVAGHDLTVAFGRTRVLDGVSIAVPPGCIAGLIGPNGAGKTTLLDCLAGSTRPAAGRVELLGRDVTGWDVAARARLGLGRTMQRLSLFGSLTVEDNVAVGVACRPTDGRHGPGYLGLRQLGVVPGDRRSLLVQARSVLARVGLEEIAAVVAADLPLGLSRRVELARAIASGARVLLLDEPSSGLSDQESSELAATLRAVRAEGSSILVVEHDMTFVFGLCDQVSVLNGGRLLAEGPPADIAVSSEVRAAYLGRGFGVAAAQG